MTAKKGPLRHILHAALYAPGEDKTLKHGDTWAHYINDYCHHVHTETFLNALLVVDIVLLVVGMQLELLYVESQNEELMHSCEHHSCPSDDEELHEVGNHAYHEAEQMVANVSVAILCIFLLHHLFLLVSNGIKFLKNSIFVLDFVVVVASIVFELAYTEAGTLSLGVVILFRTWRFVRIGHGVHELDKHHHEGSDKGAADFGPPPIPV